MRQFENDKTRKDVAGLRRLVGETAQKGPVKVYRAAEDRLAAIQGNPPPKRTRAPVKKPEQTRTLVNG